MTDVSLKARFARLGPIRAVDRVRPGSPPTFILRLPKDSSDPKVIDAMLALARRGVTMLRAKRRIEALIEDGRVFVELPTVEDVQAFVTDLAGAGIAAAFVEPSRSVDVRKLRET